MRINSIELNNIGSFLGVNKFILETNSKQNIILIGGNNGSGKTTIFTALKLGLFGSHILGLATNTEKYYEHVRTLLNNKMQSKKNARFHIALNYNEIVDYNSRNVTIKRNWELSNARITENLEICFNSVPLSNDEKLEYINFLKSNIAPSLLDSLMFDGEKIANLVEENKIELLTEDLINESFNLNIFNKMISDAESYISSESVKSNLSQEEIFLLEKRRELKTNNFELNSMINDLSEWETYYKDQITFQEKKIKEFKTLGGLTDKEISNFKKQLHGLEVKRKEKNAKINYFLENYYTFAINQGLLSAAKQKLINEIPNTISKILGVLESNSNEYYDSDELFKIKTILDGLSQEPNIHDVDISTISKISNIVAELNNGNSISVIKNNFSSLKTSKSFVSSIKSKLKTEDFEELKEFNFEIIKLNKVISSTKEKIRLLKTNIDSFENMIENKAHELVKIEREVFNQTKEKNSFKIANRIIDLNNEFILIKRKNIITKLEKMVKIKFNDLTRKRNFISKITIDRDTYSLHLKTINDDFLTFKNLSAGEKQILVACFIASIYELSRKSLPFVFDTPLSRLDNDNRSSFVRLIIKDASSQVILLSTDEEIVNKNLDILKDRIKISYLLINNGGEKTEVLKDNYFGGERL